MFVLNSADNLYISSDFSSRMRRKALCAFLAREGLIYLRLSRQAVYRAVTIDVRPQREFRFFFKLDCIRISSKKLN